MPVTHRSTLACITTSSILCALIICFSLLNAQPSASNAGYLSIPQRLTAEQAFNQDQSVMNLQDLSLIRRWMEAAWNAELPEACDEHKAKATLLANRFPSLLSAWRVLWYCADLSQQRRYQMRVWIVQLLNRLKPDDKHAAFYQERGLAVHNFTDALAYIDLNNHELMDAWYQTYAEGRQLRIGTLYWNQDLGQEETYYFTPQTTIKHYQAAVSEDKGCRIRLALCLTENIALSQYPATQEIANALAQQDKDLSASVQSLYQHRQSSIKATTLAMGWLIDHPSLFENSSEMLDELIDTGLKLNSAIAKLVQGIRLNTDSANNETHTQAIEYLNEARNELGVPEYLWQFYQFSSRLNPEHTENPTLLSSAAHKGSTDAMYAYAILLENNPDIEVKSEQQAAFTTAEWLIRAATQKHREAMFELGHRFMIGKTFERNQSKAIHWWEKAALLGHQEAIIQLSKMITDTNSQADTVIGAN